MLPATVAFFVLRMCRMSYLIYKTEVNHVDFGR
jgi:hypothetical protein